MRIAANVLALIFVSFATVAHGAQETNASIVQRCSDAMNRHDIETYVACWAPNVRNNGREVRSERIRETVTDILRTFPDYRSTMVAIVAQGDTVVTQSMQSGTHRGVARTNFNGGLKGIEPTGRRMVIRTTHWWRLQDGKIVEHQAVRDDLTMMRQLGLAPPPPP